MIDKGNCKHCGENIADDDLFCIHCGKSVKEDFIQVSSTSDKVCPTCGRQISISSAYCQYCGQIFPESADISSKIMGIRSCVSCGRQIDFDANICQYCGYDYRNRHKPAKEKGHPSFPLAAGILIIIAALILLLFGIIIELGQTPLYLLTEDPVNYFSIFWNNAILLILGIMAAIGGLYCLRRTHWGLALVGSMASSLGLTFLGFYYLTNSGFLFLFFTIVGTIVGVVLIILVTLSNEEFI